MSIWLILLLVLIGFTFVFFLSSGTHKAAYIIFIIWFFANGSAAFVERIKPILEKNHILSILYEAFIWLQLIYCIIGIIEAIIRIFSPDFTFGCAAISAYKKHKYMKNLEK